MNKGINLLPEQLRFKKRALITKSSMVITVFSLLIIAYMVFLGKFYLDGRRVEHLEKEISAQEAGMRLISEYRSEIELYNRKEQELQRLVKDSFPWSRIIHDIEAALPKNSLLLYLAEEKDRDEVVITVQCQNLEEVGSFINEMHNSSYWYNVQLIEIKKRDSDDKLLFTVLAGK